MSNKFRNFLIFRVNDKAMRYSNVNMNAAALFMQYLRACALENNLKCPNSLLPKQLVVVVANFVRKRKIKTI